VLKLKQELQAMQAEALNKAKPRRAREGANATDSNSRELEDEEDGDGHTASVRSLQRQLSQNIVQLETARQQLGDEQRMTRELEESKRRLASDLQARETELLTIRRDSEASLKDLLKSEVARCVGLLAALHQGVAAMAPTIAGVPSCHFCFARHPCV